MPGRQGIKPQTKHATIAGLVKLAMKPSRKTAGKLRRNGRAAVRAQLTYTPTGGDPNQRLVRLTLRAAS